MVTPRKFALIWGQGGLTRNFYVLNRCSYATFECQKCEKSYLLIYNLRQC